MMNEKAFTRIGKRLSLPEELASIILRQIEGGDFKPGEVLPSEQSLASMFHVSRTVVREALARLKFQGVIQSKRGSGPVVCALSNAHEGYDLPSVSSSIEESIGILEFRYILEGECAALAALYHTEEELAAMHTHLQEMQQAVDNGTSGLMADYRFHCLLAEAAHNIYMSSFTKFLSSKILGGVQSARYLSNQDAQRAATVLVEHRNIYNAIAARDGKEARNMARTHLYNSGVRQDLPLTPQMQAFRSLLS